MENLVFWIGIAAALAITAANFPQARKIIVTGDIGPISVWTYALLTAGNALWIVYGVLREDVPLIIANSISTALCAFILLMKCFPSSILRRIRKKR